MTRLFGTDGVRGVANRNLTPELAVSLARAAASCFVPAGGRVIIGRDSRVSGPMLESALAAGFAAAGADVELAGLIPTPAISFLIKDERAHLGAVVSASHNPPEDNGIKLFARTGRKLSVEDELAVEAVLDRPPEPDREIGSIRRIAAAATRYAAFLTGAIESEDVDLNGLSIVVDCAHGATGLIAPHVLRHLGAGVIELNTQPDGSRINVDCGSTHLDGLRAAVRSQGADLGIAFDGDGDRVLLVSSSGRVINGDHVVGIAALHWSRRGGLNPPNVVGTILGNLGLERRLEQEGIRMIRTPVGDRHVAAAMVEHGARIGGEPSGHVIFADHAPTGDGILTAVKLLEIGHETGESLETLADEIPLYPQVERNVPCSNPEGCLRANEAQRLVTDERERLGDQGRIIVRASGTQPVIRVFVEAERRPLAVDAADRLADRLQALASS
jgi:phosphoglucosamine mutase